MFIKAVETRDNSTVIVNTKNISAILPDSDTIVMNGIRAYANGCYHLRHEDIEKILSNISCVM